MQLADTNVVSELMRNTPHAHVQRWADTLDRAGTAFAIGGWRGDEIPLAPRRSPNAPKWGGLGGFRAETPVRPAAAEIARRAGEMRALLSLQGQVREQADMLIAATAQVHALTLVTRNVRDFDGCGIAVSNPFEA